MSIQIATQSKASTTGRRTVAAVSLAMAALSMTACAGPVQAPATQVPTQGETRPAAPILELNTSAPAAETKTQTSAVAQVAPVAPVAPAAPVAEAPAAVQAPAQQQETDGRQVFEGSPVDGYVTAPEGLPEGMGYTPGFTLGETMDPVTGEITGPVQAPVQQQETDGRQFFEGSPVDGYVTAPEGLPDGMGYTPGFTLGETFDPVTGEYTGPGEAPAPIVVTPPPSKYPQIPAEPVVVPEPAPVEQIEETVPAPEDSPADCSTYNGMEIVAGWACPPAGLPEGMGYVPGFTLGETFDPVTGEYTGPGEAPAPIVVTAPPSKYLEVTIG